jgi:hypothetical protein
LHFVAATFKWPRLTSEAKALNMKFSRHQVIGSLLLALIVLALLVVRAWPLLFPK